MGRSIFKIFCFLILGSSVAHAEIHSRNRAALGFTDNANLEDTNRDSDLFMRLSSANTFAAGEHTLGFRIGYNAYAHEKRNDLFSWSLSDRVPIGDEGDWMLEGAIGGVHYPLGDPGTTDLSFDHYILDLNATTEYPLSGTTDVSFGPGYELLYFPGFNNRSDHGFFFSGGLDHFASPDLTLNLHGEVGLVMSTLSDYSRLYLDVGGGGDYELKGGWTLGTDLSVRYSSFLSRTIATTTTVTNRRGKVTRTISSAHETYTQIGLTTDAIYHLNEAVEAGFELGFLSQVSASGLQDYSAREVLAKATFTF